MPKYPREPRKRAGRYLSGRRTDTQPVGRIRDEEGKWTYTERRNGSKYPKDTTIAISRPLKRMLHVFKNVGGYPNMDELIFSLLSERVEAHSLPKFSVGRALVDDVRHDIDLKREARHRAIQKGRFIPSEQKKPRSDLERKLVDEVVKKIQNLEYYKSLIRESRSRSG